MIGLLGAAGGAVSRVQALTDGRRLRRRTGAEVRVAQLVPQRRPALLEQLGADGEVAGRGSVAQPQEPSWANTGTSWIAALVRL
jgi:hypothetical protein